MKLVDYMYQVLDQINIADEFSIRRAKEESFAQYQAYRIQYHRPDRILDIIQEYEQRTEWLNTKEHAQLSFHLFVLEALNKALLLNGETLFRNLATSFMDYVVSDSFWKIVQSKGYPWVTKNVERANRLVVKQLIRVDHNLKRMTLDDFINGYDASITAFDKNTFVEYGDEEEEYSPEEMDNIIAHLQNSPAYTESGDTDDLIVSNEEPEVNDLEAVIEWNVNRYHDLLLDALNGREIEDLFPYFNQPKKITFTIVRGENDLNDNQIRTVITRLQNCDFLGYHVNVVLDRIETDHYEFYIERMD